MGKRVAGHLLVLTILYFNVAGLALVCGVRVPKLVEAKGVVGPLPNYWATEHLFRIFDVFDRWSWTNWELAAYGSRTPLGRVPAAPTPDLVDMRLFDYFPQAHGEAVRRVWLLSYRSDPARVRRSYAALATTLQRLHNEAHPGAPVHDVIFYEATWRKSAAGYRANYGQRAFSRVYP